MPNLNKVLLMGHITAAPVAKKVASTVLASFDIAVNDYYKDKKQTTFLSIEAWGKTAEFCEKYFTKGAAVFIEGKLKVETWKDAEGKTRKKTVIVAEKCQFAGNKKEDADYEEKAPKKAKIEPLDDDIEDAADNVIDIGENENEDDLPF